MLSRAVLFVAVLGTAFSAPTAVQGGEGDRLAYLDELNPWHPTQHFPKLTTPQWVGGKGVECVVTLAIDDMRDPAKYEAFLRPILTRLKKIDGRAPVSIMTCSVKPDDPQLQAWLDEGLSLECHTIDHPCPLLAGGDLAKAKSTYDRCVDLLASVPRNRPVAFRMPCCDSLNTVGPRFYSEIFNRTTEKGNFLQIDSSVFTVYTHDDPEVGKAYAFDNAGRERFRKYLPKGVKVGGATSNTFVNYIENYPYPYVIGHGCWEFPAMVPSDWSAQHLNKPNNPQTVEDWKLALDVTVFKEGVFNLVFHPHGWIKPQQIVELIDHAVSVHGTKVKFLTFRECLERLNRNLTADQPLRNAQGGDNSVRILDVNGDREMDVVISNAGVRKTRRWRYAGQWDETPFPLNLSFDASARNEPRVVFGTVSESGSNVPARAGIFDLREAQGVVWKDTKWRVQSSEGQHPFVKAKFAHRTASPRDAWLRDFTSSGQTQLVLTWTFNRVLDEQPFHHSASYHWDKNGWSEIAPARSLHPPEWLKVHNRRALRFIDFDEDGNLDLVYSDAKHYAVSLFDPDKMTWREPILSGERGKGSPEEELPAIVRADGSDNGFFVHDRVLYWQNEDTDRLPDLVDSRSFNDLLKNVEPQPKSPAAALKSMRPRPGFTIELMAAEPMVMDPVAFEWGPDYKLWVVEMADYPLGIDGQGKPGGRVRYLEDTDDDGQYDKSTLFLEDLPFPTGVLPWKNGVIVSTAPDIFYAEDTDGDGKADRREVLFTGFAEGNQQHRVNGLVRGLDRWIYCANGDSGGTVKSMKTGKTLDIRGRDLRIDPETGEMEAVAGQAQFGRNRDDLGNWFGCNNSRPIWHYVLDEQYQKRNPHYVPPDGRVDISIAPGAAPVFPTSRTLPRFNDVHAANRFTSACSAMIYRDDLFGPELKGNMFVSEPVHNLVHREIVTPNGVTFRSRRAEDEQDREFLTSTDNWFRPTMIKTGPDGALWIADMYRQTIEHPQWIPKEWQKRLDLRAGHDKGRIYRVYPVGAKLRLLQSRHRPDNVDYMRLRSSNGWERETAAALIRTRKTDPHARAVSLVGATDASPESRIQALWLADSVGDLSSGRVLEFLRDQHPAARRNGVQVAPRYLPHRKGSKIEEWGTGRTSLPSLRRSASS